MRNKTKTKNETLLRRLVFYVRQICNKKEKHNNVC